MALADRILSGEVRATWLPDRVLLDEEGKERRTLRGAAALQLSRSYLNKAAAKRKGAAAA